MAEPSTVGVPVGADAPLFEVLAAMRAMRRPADLWVARVGFYVAAINPIGRPRGKLGPVKRQPASAVIHRDRWQG